MGVALKIQQWFGDVRHPVKTENTVVSFRKKAEANDNFDIYCFKLSDDERMVCMKATD